MFYRSQFWRLQKPSPCACSPPLSFIGHNFGDYKNSSWVPLDSTLVLSVTILETTKTLSLCVLSSTQFYRSQFWRLQKLLLGSFRLYSSFIGHNFGDYKNCQATSLLNSVVLSVTILETTKTSNGIS